MLPQKNGDFTFFTLKNLSLIMNLTKFFCLEKYKNMLKGKNRRFKNKEADYY